MDGISLYSTCTVLLNHGDTVPLTHHTLFDLLIKITKYRGPHQFRYHTSQVQDAKIYNQFSVYL